MKAIYENHYLSDRDVANFARQSFGKLADQFPTEQNNNLIRFLARGMKTGDWEALIDSMILAVTKEQATKLANYLRKIPEHWVPFGHPHISLRMQAPVPIARQAFKHKIGFVESEESRRYISSRPELFVPEHFRATAENVKQGSAGVHPLSDHWRGVYERKCTEMIETYLLAIDSGVCPEQARLFLPQGCEVNWVWTGSLYAFANFYNQRSDSHAQVEIQQLAEQVNEIIAPLYPVSWAALTGK
ncbi:FAD-dependent thymidylate synthase [Stutzerimonas stutzeri]|uniref:FAD-dependent thymidylate synthase n=1 Tax=Stutzerimonas stutzeri TaxID=316 RepID=UPI003B78D43F